MTVQAGRDEGTMGCRDVRDLAEAFVSDQVLDGTAQAITAHLDSCPRCSGEVADLRRLRTFVRKAYLGQSGSSPSH